MIAMFDIFTLLYKEAKELISKWFYRFPKGKTQKCSSSHQFMLQRKGIYGRNESEGKANNGAKKHDIVGKDADLCSLFLHIYTQIKIYNGLL